MKGIYSSHEGVIILPIEILNVYVACGLIFFCDEEETTVIKSFEDLVLTVSQALKGFIGNDIVGSDLFHVVQGNDNSGCVALNTPP